MRKIILLFVICFYKIGVAQEYTANLNLYVKANSSGSYGGGCRNDIEVKVMFTDGSEMPLLNEDLNGISRTNYTNFKSIKTFPKNKTVYKVLIYTSRNWKRAVGGCGGSGSFNRSERVKNIFFCENYFDEYSDAARWWDVKFSLDFYPIISLTQNNNTIIGFDDNFSVSVDNHSKGFKVSDYKWKYQVVATGRPKPGKWLDMPNSVYGDSFSIKPSDFLNKADIGKKLYLKIGNCGSDSESDEIYYDLRPSAPHIKLDTPSITSCYYTNDGKVRVYLDRSLGNGEILTLNLEKDGLPISSYVNLSANDFDASDSFLINGLEAGSYNVRVFEPPFYTDGDNHKATFKIDKPEPVEFTVETTNVNCNGGSDGTITINATGGTGSYMYQINSSAPQAFSNSKTHIESGLPKGWFTISIKDTNGCIAQKILRDGNGNIIGSEGELEKTIEITQPDAALSVEFSTLEDGGIKEPTSYGFSNGRITAKVNGGTKLPDATYDFIWQYFDALTASWVNWTDFNYNYDAPAKEWAIILKNAKAGNYKLSVADKNGCTITDRLFTLNQPPKLSVSITETHAISCNNANTFEDDSSDGELTAIGTGGVPLKPTDNNGLPYYYKWKKKDANGIYQEIVGADINVLSNRDAGDYAVNIIDANGITVGTATNNVVTPVDALKTLSQPDLLQITLTKVDVFCNSGSDGIIDATITGGTGNYKISWSNNATTEDISTLTAGTYTINVIDDAGCRAQATIIINEPALPLEIKYTAFFAPTFTGATNGWIEATVTGGTPLNSGIYTYYMERCQRRKFKCSSYPNN